MIYDSNRDCESLVDEFFDIIDTDKSGTIEFEEWIFATVDKHYLLSA